MKANLKIILLPTIVMTCIFAFSIIIIEHHQKSVLKQQLERELTTLSSFSLSAVEMISYGFSDNELDSSFDLLADKIAKASSYRISYFFSNGQLLGDSNLSFSQIRTMQNHINRTEIQQALKQGLGKAQRFSSTLKKEMVYIAKFDAKTGFIARVSLPADTYQTAIVNLRWGFSVIVIVTIIMIIIFGMIVIKINHLTIQKERRLQATRIIARTQQLTLIQAMSTMLNSAHSMDDAARLLANILPQLLPTFDGAIYIGIKPNQAIRKLVHWGDSWPESTPSFVQKKLIEEMESEFHAHEAPYVSSIEQLSAKELCINLSCGNDFFGFLHLISKDKDITEKLIDVTKKTAEQLALALSNLHIKDNLRAQATRDPLTNLYNRRFMLEAFEQAIHRAERHNIGLAFILLDLDYFKVFNDNFGHDAGDFVLTKVANSLKNNLRLEDIACRYGGEEFCIICPDTNLKDSFQLAEKIRHCISELDLTFNDQNLGQVTTSIGVALFPNHANTINELIYHADKALYQAKAKGRNNTDICQSLSIQQKSS